MGFDFMFFHGEKYLLQNGRNIANHPIILGRRLQWRSPVYNSASANYQESLQNWQV